MKCKAIIPIITLLLGGLTPAIGDDLSAARSSKPIWLKSGKLDADGLYLGPNRDDYATMNKEPGDYIFVGDGLPLLHGKSYKITTGGMYLYTTAQGNAGLYSTGDDAKSSWTIEKQKRRAKIDDDVIRHGDVILLRNDYWKTSYLYDDGKGYAAAGDYPAKPREWTVDFKLTTVERAKMPANNEIIENVIYFDNRGGPASAGAKETITLSSLDEVGVKDTNSSEWSAGVSSTATIEQASVPGTIPGGSLSLTVSAAYGGAISAEIGSVKSLTISKSAETTYDRPEDCEVLILTRLSVPYANFVLSCGKEVAPISMRSINGSVSITSSTSIFIPRRDKQGNIDMVPEAEVMRVLDKLNRLDSAEAERLRKERLPVWKEKGWVGDPKLARPVVNKLVLAPGSEMKVQQKYWSENKEFYAIFQPDGNFGVSTKDDGYKWDIVTKGNAGTPLHATKLILQDDGNLVFYGPDDAFLWGINKIITLVENSTLNISNSGDLLLLAPNGSVLWRSK
jgi:hypothetical protein